MSPQSTSSLPLRLSSAEAITTGNPAGAGLTFFPHIVGRRWRCVMARNVPRQANERRCGNARCCANLDHLLLTKQHADVENRTFIAERGAFCGFSRTYQIVSPSEKPLFKLAAPVVTAASIKGERAPEPSRLPLTRRKFFLA